MCKKLRGIPSTEAYLLASPSGSSEQDLSSGIFQFLKILV